MAYQQKEGQGSLFKNDKQNDRQPDFRGTIMIKGVTYSISAWNRTSQNGRDYISLQAEERSQYPSSTPTPAYPAPAASRETAPAAFAPAPTEADMPPFSDEEDLPF